MANGVENKVDELVVKYENKKHVKSSLDVVIDNNVDDEELDSKSVKQHAFEEGIRQLFTKDNLQMKTELCLATNQERLRLFLTRELPLIEI